MAKSAVSEIQRDNQTKELADLLLQQEPQDITEKNFQEQFRKDAQDNWKQNSKQYNRLLSIYVDNTQKSLMLKQFQKNVFFWASVFILIAVTVVMACTLYMISVSTQDIAVLLLQVIPALTTFLTPLFILPKTIVNYLFTTKDEEHMIQIIEQIIQHDDSSLQS